MTLIFKSLKEQQFDIEKFENQEKFKTVFSSVKDITGSSDLNPTATKLTSFSCNSVTAAYSGEEPVGLIVAGFDGYRGRVYHLTVRADLSGNEVAIGLLNSAIRELKAAYCKRLMIYCSMEEGRLHEPLLKQFGLELFAEGFYYKADYKRVVLNDLNKDVTVLELSIPDWEIVKSMIFGEGRWSGVGDDFDGFKTFVNHQGCKVFLALVDNKNAGLVYSASDGCFGSIWHLFVNPEFRKFGLGSSLLSIALKHQRSMGVEEATISVVKDNLVAHKFWSRHSFSPLGKEVFSGNI